VENDDSVSPPFSTMLVNARETGVLVVFAPQDNCLLWGLGIEWRTCYPSVTLCREARLTKSGER